MLDIKQNENPVRSEGGRCKAERGLAPERTVVYVRANGTTSKERYVHERRRVGEAAGKRAK